MIDELNSTDSVFIDLHFYNELLEKNYAAFLELLKNGEFDNNFRTKFFKGEIFYYICKRFLIRNSKAELGYDIYP